jgi:hypothetical protein
MESVDVYSSELDVENAALNDVKGGYYCRKLVDHLELKPYDVCTSSHPEVETQLVIASGMEGSHDVGPKHFTFNLLL